MVRFASGSRFASPFASRYDEAGQGRIMDLPQLIRFFRPANYRAPNLKVLNMDAFSKGQMESKLWLCEQLESHFPSLSTVYVYGSWYGTLPFLLLSRDRIRIQRFVLFDIDEEALNVSRHLLNNWKDSKNILFLNRTCEERYEDLPEPELVINTSCEHFADLKWWSTLPLHTHFAIQSTDMFHQEHLARVNSVEELKKSLGEGQKILYSGTKRFQFGDFSFQRFMLIGTKITSKTQA